MLLYIIIVPFLLSFSIFFLSPLAYLAMLLPAGLLMGLLYGNKENLNEIFQTRYLPVYLPIFLVTGTAAVLMLITKGFLGHDYWLAFILLTFPFLPSSVISALNGEILNVFLVPFFYYLFTLLGFIIFERQRKDRVIFDKKQVLIGTGAIVLFLGISGGVMWERSKTVLPPSYGFGYEKGYSSVDLGPYDVTNKKNKLAKLNGSSSLVILYFLSFKLSCRIIGKKDYSC